MQVQELFRRMSYAELSNLAIGAEGAGMIQENRQPAMFHAVNEGLLALHGRFLLKEKSLMLITQAHITNYSLRLNRAISQPAVAGVDQYIYDSVRNPFKDDVIKVLRVIGFDGYELGLNDEGSYRSAFTPQPDVVQLVHPRTNDNYSVIYQAKHPHIEYGDLCAQIDLPAVLESALTSYIAAGVFGNMVGQENTAKGQEFLMKYEAHCQQVIDMDLVSNSVSTSTHKLHQRGFV